MKSSFLKSLAGFTVKAATAKVLSEGLEVIPIVSAPYSIMPEEKSMVAFPAYGNTVLLWLDGNNIVVEATAGDPCEVVNG